MLKKSFPIAAILFLALGAGLVFRLTISPAQAASGEIFIDPPVGGAAVGAVVTVSLQTSGLAEIYAADVVLSFDAARLQVEDADLVAGGIQVIEGTCPAADFTVFNEADNTTGLITYTVTQLNPTAACSSGDILQVAFSCTAVGSGSVSVESSLLSDRNGQAIAHTASNGSIVCIANPPAAVLDLAAVPASLDLELTWTAVTSDTLDNPTLISTYQVHRGTAPYYTPTLGTLLDTSPTPAYTDTAAVGDATTNYFYFVLAEDIIGFLSSPSNPVGEFDFELVPAALAP